MRIIILFLLLPWHLMIAAAALMLLSNIIQQEQNYKVKRLVLSMKICSPGMRFSYLNRPRQTTECDMRNC